MDPMGKGFEHGSIVLAMNVCAFAWFAIVSITFWVISYGVGPETFIDFISC